MLRNTMVALGLAAIAALSFPAAASASSFEAGIAATCSGVDDSNYANPSIVTADKYVVDPGDTVVVTWHDGFFLPSESVTVAVSGAVASSVGIASTGGSSSGTAQATADANPTHVPGRKGAKA